MVDKQKPAGYGQTTGDLPPQAVERYFVDVAGSVEIPLCRYSNPSVLRNELSVDVIERLSHVNNISYVKDAGTILSIINRCEERLEVFSASAHIPALVLRLGGVGWMAGPACVLPSESVPLYELAQAGRWQEAMALQREGRAKDLRAPLPSRREEGCAAAAGLRRRRPHRTAATRRRIRLVGDPIPSRPLSGASEPVTADGAPTRGAWPSGAAGDSSTQPSTTGGRP